MKGCYRVVKKLDDGLMVIRSAHGEQLWTRRTSRRTHWCQATGRPIAPGDPAYGPLGNAANRGQRLSAAFVEGVE